LPPEPNQLGYAYPYQGVQQYQGVPQQPIQVYRA
jgi:hypothetical protein